MTDFRRGCQAEIVWPHLLQARVVAGFVGELGAIDVAYPVLAMFALGLLGHAPRITTDCCPVQ